MGLVTYNFHQYTYYVSLDLFLGTALKFSLEVSHILQYNVNMSEKKITLVNHKNQSSMSIDYFGNK